MEGKQQVLDSQRKQIREQVVWGCVEASVRFYLSINFLFKNKATSQQFSRDTSHLFFHLLLLPRLLGRIFQPSASWRTSPEEQSRCHSHSPGRVQALCEGLDPTHRHPCGLLVPVTPTSQDLKTSKFSWVTPLLYSRRSLLLNTRTASTVFQRDSSSSSRSTEGRSV